MSEIKVLAGLDVAIKSVDSMADEEHATVVARKLAAELGCIIAITGKNDMVTAGREVVLYLFPDVCSDAASSPGMSYFSADMGISRLYLRIEEHFRGVPQVIEWSYGSGKFYIL